MSVKQIGELTDLESIPVDAKGLVVDNSNDANTLPMDTLISGLCNQTISSLGTRDKTLKGAINELYAFATGDIWVGTQEQYDALEEYDRKIYLISNAPVLLWVGTQEQYEGLSSYSQDTLYIIVEG